MTQREAAIIAAGLLFGLAMFKLGMYAAVTPGW